MSITSYAQNFEDVMLWRVLEDATPGCYIDVGAQHPVVDSVSKAFYEQGWRGIHVEPTIDHANLLRADRPDETIIQAVVAAESGVLDFYEISGGGLSTARQDIAAEHQSKLGCSVVKILVTAVTLDDIFALCTTNTVHWLKIDVEGFEREVLTGWRESSHRPWVVVMEATYPCTTRDTFEIWEDLILAKGYDLVYRDGLNRFYLHQTQHERKARFAFPPNVFDSFQLSGTATSMTSDLTDRHRQELSHLHVEIEGKQNQVAQLLAERQKLLESQETTNRTLENSICQTLERENASLGEQLKAILERERTFAEQLMALRADEFNRMTEVRHAHDAHEARLRGNSQAQINALYETLDQYSNYSRVLEKRITAMQTTWWWRLSMPWRRSSKWPALIISPNSPQDDLAPQHKKSPQLFGATPGAPAIHIDIAAQAPSPSAASSNDLPPLSLPTRDEFTMRIQHITELFVLDGRTFVTEAYRNLFNREPDAHGLAYYLGRLAMGYGKSSVIVQLAKSPDCIPHNEISGLKEIIADEKRANHWLWGALLRRSRFERSIQSALTAISRIDQRLDSLSSAIFMQARHSEQSPHQADNQLNIRDFEQQAFEASANASKIEAMTMKMKIRQPWTEERLLDLDDEDFIDAIYDAVLHRKPDDGGKSFFLSELRQGRGKPEILKHLINCDEAKDQPDNFIYLNAKIDMLTAAVDGIWSHIKKTSRRSQ